MATSTPIFRDVSKTVEDLFKKGYYFDKLRLDIRTKASPGIEFSFGGIQDLTTKNVVGSIEAKYKFKDQGVTFVERWNTNNVLGAEVIVEDFCDGVKVSCETSFIPTARRKSTNEDTESSRSGSQIWTYSDKTMRLKGSYKNSSGQLDIESDFKSGTNPIFKTGVAVNYMGFFTGCGGVFDHNHNRIKEHVVGGGFATRKGDFSALLTIKNFRILSSMTFYRFSNSLETALTASFSLDGSNRTFGLACKYFLDDDTAIRLKISEKADLGVGFSQRINSSATVFLSALVNTSPALTGSFHMGFCLELNA